MLRDMQTRFGGNYLTYSVAIGWPLSHLILLVVAFVVANKLLPFGTDSVLYISTGALPYILCLYPMRMMALMMVHSGGSLNFPIVASFHLILARMILEGLSAIIVTLIFACGLWMLDFDIVPLDLPAALMALYAAIFFGLSLGALQMILRALFKTAGYGGILLLMIVLYISSGVYLPPSPQTDTMRTLLGFNPVYHLVQWMRSAYFQIDNPVPIDKVYVLRLSVLLLFLALAGERMFRGKVLRG